MNNAPPHRASILSNFINKKNIELLPDAPYSPGMAPCDFFLFPEIKNNMRGIRYYYRNKVRKALTDQLKRVSKDGFDHVYRQLFLQWEKCIKADGRYFEKETLNQSDSDSE